MVAVDAGIDDAGDNAFTAVANARGVAVTGLFAPDCVSADPFRAVVCLQFTTEVARNAADACKRRNLLRFCGVQSHSNTVEDCVIAIRNLYGPSDPCLDGAGQVCVPSCQVSQVSLACCRVSIQSAGARCRRRSRCKPGMSPRYWESAGAW